MLKMADLPPLINVTPSPYPDGTSLPVGLVFPPPGTFPPPPLSDGFLLHEDNPTSSKPTSTKYKFLITVRFGLYYNWFVLFSGPSQRNTMVQAKLCKYNRING